MRKAAVKISVKTVIIIIIAIAFLGLYLGKITTTFETATTSFEEQANINAPKPTAEIYLEPYKEYNEYSTDGVINADASRSYDRSNTIIDYYWDTDGDGSIDKSGVDSVQLEYNSPGTYEVTVKVLNDRGGFDEETATIRIYSGNEKNMSKYGDVMFFIQENHAQILQWVPITNWVDRNGQHTYPYVVYHEATGTFNSDEIQEQLQAHQKSSAIVIAPDEQYFNYWIFYSSTVLVDLQELDTIGVQAAIYASELNAPLVFVDGSETQLVPFLTNTLVHVVSAGALTDLSPNVQTFLSVFDTELVNPTSTRTLQSDITIKN